MLLFISMPFAIYNTSLAVYAAPFSAKVTAFASGMGDSCADSIGYPPLLGFYGTCRGTYTRSGSPSTRATIAGPSYSAGADSRAIPAVVTVGIDGLRAVERPSGWLLPLGILAPWLFYFGLVTVNRH